MNKTSSWFRLRMLVILAMLGLLAACGGGSGTPNDTAPPGTPPSTPEVPAPPSPPTTPPITPVGAGELKSATELKTVTAVEIAAALAAGDERAKGFTPVYSVKTYRLEYLTSDADGLPVRAFQTTNATKAQIIDALALAFERGEITILNDPTLVGELQAYEMQRLPSGMARYSAPEGMHDDTVMALALAWHAVGRSPSEAELLDAVRAFR